MPRERNVSGVFRPTVVALVDLVAVLCIAEILTMTGVATYAALLPVLPAEWTATD